MQLSGRTAVITGASGGIGRALAVELGLRGASVILAARSAAGLAETAALLAAYGVPHRSLPLDLTSESSIESFLAELAQTCPRIDVFVNNAAVGLFSKTAVASRQDVETVFQTNLWGPLTLMQALVPRMTGGTLVSISSAAANYAPFQQGAYAASKAALERLTEAVGTEEHGRVRTLVVVPDRTATPFLQHVVGPREGATLGLSLRFATPEHVARRVAEALERDRSLCYTTSRAHAYAVLSVLAPGLVERLIRKASA